MSEMSNCDTALPPTLHVALSFPFSPMVDNLAEKVDECLLNWGRRVEYSRPSLVIMCSES